MKFRQLFTGVALAASQLSCQTFRSPRPVEWEHGWKTDRVTATRMKGDLGYNIQLEYPKNPADCDRAEIDDLIRAHGGAVFQSGGYLGAPMYVKFTGVNDRASADKKLQEVLPILNKLMDDITAGKEIPKIVDPNAKSWPDTEAPSPGSLGSMNVNGTQYMQSEVSPGKWQWVVDEDAMKRLREYNEHKYELWLALTTRVITNDELKEVASYGNDLNVQSGVLYNATEKLQELNNALLIQQMLRHSDKPIAVTSK